MLACDLVGVADVGLAHLHETAALRQQVERGVHELARERVQHDIHPAPAGRGRKRSLNSSVREEAMCASSNPSERSASPLRGARGGEHLGAQVPRQLHRGHPDTARARVHQHPLARLQRGQIAQRVVGGQERRSAPTPPARTTILRESARADGDRRSRPGRTPPASRPITRSPTAKPSTSAPTSNTTPAPSPPMVASPGYMPSAISTSRKFKPAGAHADAHLARARALAPTRGGHQRQALERPAATGLQTPRRLPRGPRRVPSGSRTRESRGEQRACAYSPAAAHRRRGAAANARDEASPASRSTRQEPSGMLRLRAAHQPPHGDSASPDTSSPASTATAPCVTSTRRAPLEALARKPCLQQLEHSPQRPSGPASPAPSSPSSVVPPGRNRRAPVRGSPRRPHPPPRLSAAEIAKCLDGHPCLAQRLGQARDPRRPARANPLGGRRPVETGRSLQSIPNSESRWASRSAAQLLGGDLARHQRVDRCDQPARLVGEQQRDGVVARRARGGPATRRLRRRAARLR